MSPPFPQEPTPEQRRKNEAAIAKARLLGWVVPAGLLAVIIVYVLISDGAC